MRIVFGLAGVVLVAIAQAPVGPFAALLKRTAKPAESADWRPHKISADNSSLLLPRDFNARPAPDGETTTVLYCIAGASPRDYRLVKVVADAYEVPEPGDDTLGKFAGHYLDHVLGKRLRDAKIVERGVVELGGGKAFLLVGDGVTAGGLRSAVVTIVLRSGGTTLHLSGSCLEENLEKYSEMFAQVFSSWKAVGN